MLQSFSGFLLAVFFTSLLISCAGVDEQPRDYQVIQKQAVPNNFAAWDTTNNNQNNNKAVEGLLGEADVLMREHQLEKASDKLERLLSIEPNSSQAWSRLSWIALKNNKLSRAKQMAQRSNTQASANNQLKILNWSFIRTAAQRAGDVATISKAEKMIDSLSASEKSLQ